MRPFFYLPLLSLFALSSCYLQPLEVEVLQRGEMRDILSASGLSKMGDHYYAVGDDAAFLYRLSEDYQIAESIPLLGNSPRGRIPKSEKPDFEAIATLTGMAPDQLLIFGSGSRPPKRDILVRYCPTCKSPVKRYSLHDFYGKLRQSAFLDSSTLNIEGAAIHGEQLYLLNRQKNLVLVFPLSKWLHYLNGQAQYPEPQVFQLRLPVIDGLESTLSGLCFLAGSERFIFTASVEDNRNPVDDGAILGSFVGSFLLRDLADGYAPPARRLRTHSNGYLQIKAESVAVLKQTASNAVQLLLVTDSDGGPSQFLEVEMSWR